MLRAIKNRPNQNQPEVAQLEDSLADPPLTIGHNATHFLATIYPKNYDHAYGVKYDKVNFFIGSKRVKIIYDDLMIDGEKFDMTRNLWKLLNVANPGDLYEYPEEDAGKYEKLMFNTKLFLKEDYEADLRKIY